MSAVGVSRLHRGVITLSFDTELAWGSFDRMSIETYQHRYPDARSVNERLLETVRSFGLSATWAVVGALLLKGRADPNANGVLGVRWESDFAAKAPMGDETTHPLCYASDLVGAIAACDVPQEIGCHGFSHELATRLTPETFRSELRACRALARTIGRELKSFVYPRNVEAHHDVLVEEGFLCYRGGAAVWPRAVMPLLRVKRFIDAVHGAPPSAVMPVLHKSGLVNVPESLFFGTRDGTRRFVSLRSRLTRILAGIEAASAERRVFHLWLHPFNLCSDPESLFFVLAAALREIYEQRREGRIEVLTMSEVAERWRVGEL